MKRKVATRKQAEQPNKKQQLADDAFDWSAAGGADDMIASDSGNEQNEAETDDESNDEEVIETADEKRIRLAKEYLEKIAEQEEGSGDEGEDGVDRIGARLHQEALEAVGKVFKLVAHNLQEFEFDEGSFKFIKGHRLAITGLCLSDDGRTAFTSSKDGTIIRWNLAENIKVKLSIPKDDVANAKTDRQRTILAIALSTDSKYLASGGCDKLVRIWDTEKNELLESFSGHRDTITSLAFRMRSHMLFSGSLDRTIKHWNLTEMGYVETLFGHQAEVNGLDALYKERIVSCGRDRSVRMWKIPEETQLVFYGNSGSMDCVKMINDEHYVTGGDDGSLSLWFNGKKKPVHVVRNAHGGKWISSVSVMPRTDLVASGSSDGVIRLWKADLKERSLIKVATIPMEGVINAIVFENKGRFLVAAVSQEHRLGRWEVKKNVKNGIAIVALPDLSDD